MKKIFLLHHKQSDEKGDASCKLGGDRMTRSASGGAAGTGMVGVDEGGLILPKKPYNPCKDSVDRQNLHRELLFNQKIGKNVLNQKSELQKAIEKHKDNQSRKEIEQKRLESRTPLQRVIEERAKRLEIGDKGLSDDESGGLESDANKPEFLEIHARLRAKMEAK